MKTTVLILSTIFCIITLSGCTQNKDIAAQNIKPLDTITQEKQENPTQPSQNQTQQKETSMKQYTKAEQVIDAKKTYEATLHTTKGDITIALTAKETPVTVNNFVFLAKQAFYNGTMFHRTINGFMIQGGDPTGTGAGGPGYRFADEPFEGEYTKGTVAMANAGPNTNGSQFFIMHSDTPLPKNYVIFGHVIKGLDIVDAIATAPVQMSASGEESKPVSPVSITSVDIAEK